MRSADDPPPAFTWPVSQTGHKNSWKPLGIGAVEPVPYQHQKHGPAAVRKFVDGGVEVQNAEAGGVVLDADAP